VRSFHASREEYYDTMAKRVPVRLKLGDVPYAEKRTITTQLINEVYNRTQLKKNHEGECEAGMHVAWCSHWHGCHAPPPTPPHAVPPNSPGLSACAPADPPPRGPPEPGGGPG
jgi:hypothetical protein